MSLRGNIERFHVGETVRMRAKAYDPETNEVVVPTSAQVEWWAPETDRTTDPPTVTTAFGFREGEQDYVVFQPTDGWAPGRWTYKVSVVGTQYTNVSVGAVTINP